VFSMLNYSTSILRVQGHHNIEEVASINLAAFGKMVWHIPAELRVLNHLWPKILYTQLIIQWNVNPLYCL
jgi:hypothetical protein